MRGRFGTTRWRMAAYIGGALYAFFLIAAPFEHHDIECHLKSPQHCTSCNSSLVGSDPHPVGTPGVSSFVDLGSAIALQQSIDEVLLVKETTGRSPPPVSL
jgi:hypothetical protein